MATHTATGARPLRAEVPGVRTDRDGTVRVDAGGRTRIAVRAARQSSRPRCPPSSPPTSSTATTTDGSPNGAPGCARWPRRRAASSGVEVFEGEAATPEAVAQRAERDDVRRRPAVHHRGRRRALEGRRGPRAVAPALAEKAPRRPSLFFAREEGRVRRRPKLAEAVERADGDIAARRTVKPKELPKLGRRRGQAARVELDCAAAQALVAHVGERQQRLCASSRSSRSSSARGTDRRPGGRGVARRLRRAPGLGVRRRARGRRPPRPRAASWSCAPRVSDAAADPVDGPPPARGAAIADAPAGGESPAEVKARHEGNPWAVGRRIEEAREADPDALRAPWSRSPTSKSTPAAAASSPRTRGPAGDRDDRRVGRCAGSPRRVSRSRPARSRARAPSRR